MQVVFEDDVFASLYEKSAVSLKHFPDQPGEEGKHTNRRKPRLFVHREKGSCERRSCCFWEASLLVGKQAKQR